MTRARWIAVALAAAALLLVARVLAVAFVEYRWFAAFGPGALDVWRARTVDLTILRAGAALAAALLLYLNLLGVASTIDAVAVSRRLGGIEIAETVPAGRLRGLLALASLVFGLVMALPISDWTAADALLTNHAFGEIEPYTGRDLAFFVYWLPLENSLYEWTLVAVAFVTGAVVALYALTPGLRWSGGRIRATVRVRRHLALFGVATLLLLAWGHRLDAYALLVDGSGTNAAFVGTDELALLPTRFALAVASALAAVVVLRAGWAGQARLAFWAVTAVVVTTVAGRTLAGPIASVAVAPARLATANAAASANRALYTRRAYAGDRVREAADAGLVLPSVRDASDNVAIWDAGPLARVVAAPADLRAARATVGWQVLGDTIDATLAQPRVDPARGDPGRLAGAPAWRAVRVDPRTAPPLPPTGRGNAAAVLDVPGVAYPGAGDAAVVRDPDGTVVGSSFRSWGVRLAAALAERDLRLLDADDVGRGDAERGDPARGETRLVRRRDPRSRVQALLPFFTVGRDATPVADGDSLWWAVPLLAASADYPLAAHLAFDGYGSGELSTLRHAGTALVNAATGAVLVVPPPDPDGDVRQWYARFPRLATRTDALPAPLAAALPIPYDAALAQAYAFAEFGPRGASVPPARRVVVGEAPDSAASARPATAFAVRTAAGAGAPSSVTATSFPLVTQADRVAGVVVATGGATPVTAWIAAAQPGARWQDVSDSTAAQTDGAPTPDRRAAAAASDGAVRAVPTTAGLLFVRTQYAAGAEGRPTLAGVTALFNDRVVRGPQLRGLFDSAGGAPPAPRPLAPEERVVNARALYEESRRALQRGDWPAFGRALEALGRALAPVP